MPYLRDSEANKGSEHLLEGTSILPKYLAYWGLEHPPFTNANMDHGPFIPASQHDDWQRLLLNCEKNSNLILLSSPPGGGKTSIGNWIYRTLSTQAHDAIFLTLMEKKTEGNWFWLKLAKYFGIKSTDKSDAMRQVALELEKEERGLTIFIDEADYLTNQACYEEIILFLNAAQGTKMSINIVLIGLPNWMKAMQSRPQTAHLISHAYLAPLLKSKECKDYIHTCLQDAGLQPSPFENAAYGKIYQMTQGNYAKINTVTESCLVEGFFSQKKAIDATTVQRATKNQANPTNITTSDPELVKIQKEPSMDLAKSTKISEEQDDPLSSLFYTEESS